MRDNTNLLEQQFSLQKVFLGDRGFLTKYGSKLSNGEIYELMNLAVSKGDLGISAGDLRTLKTASMVSGSKIIYHVYLPLVHARTREIASNYLSLLYENLFAWSSSFVLNDPLVGYTYRKFANRNNVIRKDSQNILSFDETMVSSELSAIEKYKPAMVTIGGDFFDLCLILDRFDLIEDICLKFNKVCKRNCISIGFLTYIGAIFFDQKKGEAILDNIDAIILPMNCLGFGMVPNKDELINWAYSIHKSIIGIHTLGLNKISLSEALKYSFLELKLNAVIIGASSRVHINEIMIQSKLYI